MEGGCHSVSTRSAVCAPEQDESSSLPLLVPFSRIVNRVCFGPNCKASGCFQVSRYHTSFLCVIWQSERRVEVCKYIYIYMCVCVYVCVVTVKVYSLSCQKHCVGKFKGLLMVCCVWCGTVAMRVGRRVTETSVHNSVYCFLVHHTSHCLTDTIRRTSIHTTLINTQNIMIHTKLSLLLLYILLLLCLLFN